MTTHRVTPLISTDPADLLSTGIQVSLSPVDAENAGAFVEDALSEAHAWDANELPSGLSTFPLSQRRSGMSVSLRVV